jgi:surface antigen
VGPDATKFKNDWWPGHRTRLQQLRTDLEGFGQSAHNNASEQETASSSQDGGGGAVDRHDVIGIGPFEPRLPGGPAVPHVEPGDPHYSLTDPEQALRDGFRNDWRQVRPGLDQWNFGYDNDGDAKFGDCTSYVAWRLNKIAAENGLGDNYFTNNKLGDHTNLHFGNARDWGEQATALGHAPDGAPAAGAVAWWDKSSPLGDYGHVAVVRSVNADGSITIEQSAWDSYDLKIETIRPGDKRFPTGFLHLLPNS